MGPDLRLLVAGVGIPISLAIWKRVQGNLYHGDTLSAQATHITVLRVSVYVGGLETNKDGGV